MENQIYFINPGIYFLITIFLYSNSYCFHRKWKTFSNLILENSIVERKYKDCFPVYISLKIRGSTKTERNKNFHMDISSSIEFRIDSVEL